MDRRKIRFALYVSWFFFAVSNAYPPKLRSSSARATHR